MPVFVDDDGRSLDAFATWQFFPQKHTGVHVTVFKETFGHLHRKTTAHLWREILTARMATIICAYVLDYHDRFGLFVSRL